MQHQEIRGAGAWGSRGVQDPEVRLVECRLELGELYNAEARVLSQVYVCLVQTARASSRRSVSIKRIGVMVRFESAVAQMTALRVELLGMSSINAFLPSKL